MASTEEKFGVLSRVAGALNRAGITWGVGASLLLYFQGIADRFNDIDIMVTLEDAEAARDILRSMGEMRPSNPRAQYRTRHFWEFVVDGVDIDVMSGFAIVKDGVTYDCPFTAESVAGHVQVGDERVPLQAVSEWRGYYALMGREEKVRMIDGASPSPQTPSGGVRGAE